MSGNSLDFLKPQKVARSGSIIDFGGDSHEKLFLLLNSQPKNFFFRFPTAADLRTITDKFKNEECFTAMDGHVKVILGNVNGFLKVLNKQEGFNNYDFLNERWVSKQYYLELLYFPEEFKDDVEETRKYEREMRSSEYIKRKKHLLGGIGISYIIHYDPVKLANQVLEDARQTLK